MQCSSLCLCAVVFVWTNLWPLVWWNCCLSVEFLVKIGHVGDALFVPLLLSQLFKVILLGSWALKIALIDLLSFVVRYAFHANCVHFDARIFNDEWLLEISLFLYKVLVTLLKLRLLNSWHFLLHGFSFLLIIQLDFILLHLFDEFLELVLKLEFFLRLVDEAEVLEAVNLDLWLLIGCCSILWGCNILLLIRLHTGIQITRLQYILSQI